ncbi:hypothetical protein [Glutamicibacter protophormiae]|uniref:Pimeloyl-ACP methyl ester carboxylesterase n=1 Tax=Glutamicibacter protophormiae TaxID=37930 RepID=A0ABS4XMJ8_GLUPR|nr:hypothetical protein [Glutamicibacter protophormiae]MBP2397729.1 pimeloyl-ACP methyl ester carboxylesterase [Glutamicibacter protophormiae]GGL87018.1 hypothetical protein GCM10010038_16320 [Glutamicibacter protophormiae]
MSKKPVLLFLHGVGDGDPNDKWRAHLNDSLLRLGYPELDLEQVLAPKFAHALKGLDDSVPVPPLTIKQPSRDAARTNRREFERRMGSVEFHLGRHNAGKGTWLGDTLVNATVGFPFFKQADNYLHNPAIRANVLQRILDQVPTSGQVVLVGHSLGSVIAADLVRRLPAAVEVVGMVTLGSPLASGKFNVDDLRKTLKEPPTNLSWWVNFWNANDPVSAHRGLTSVFPWIIDFRTHTAVLPHSAHYATGYLGDDAVASAIGYAMFGSLSREIVLSETGFDIPLDYPEQLTLLALRYAYLIKDQLAGDKKLSGDLLDRYAGALRNVQATAVEAIRKRNHDENRPMPAAIARLAFDLSDPQALAPEPMPSRHFSKDEAVVLLTVLAAENIIKPFEISVPKEKLQVALRDLTAEMGLTSQFGADVFAAAKTAQETLGGGRGINWIKWGALGAGAAAILLATGGLALAAAPGLVGAAVITSALASFGPGGMIGGLLTAGTLVTAGGGGVAYGLASPGTSAEAFEAVVERRLAAEILRERQHLDPDPTAWSTFTDIERAVRRESERLDEFSDEGSPALKELKRKIEAVERALKYLRDKELEPALLSEDSYSAV